MSPAEFALQALVAAGHVSQAQVDASLKLPGAPLSSLIPLQTGTPTEKGVYAARIDTGHGKLFAEDKMLTWMDDEWWYSGGSTRCRYEVLAWIGPLQRRIP